MAQRPGRYTRGTVTSVGTATIMLMEDGSSTSVIAVAAYSSPAVNDRVLVSIDGSTIYAIGKVI